MKKMLKLQVSHLKRLTNKNKFSMCVDNNCVAVIRQVSEIIIKYEMF